MARLIFVVLVFCGWVAPAAAADVFFYSDVDEHYGWSAGYNYARAESDAHSACTEFGGTDCKFAAECDGGWGSIAFADDSAKGVGMACGINNAADVRIYALALCIVASNAMCWTELTFSPSGNELDKDGNYDFDRIYLGQQILRVLEYDVGSADGEMGPRTRNALKAFQQKLGLEPTGVLDDALFWRLMDAVGGPQAAAAGLKEAVVDSAPAEMADRSYSTSSQPFPVMTYSKELALRADIARRESLATMLTLWDNPCTIPANSAVPVPEDGSGGWHVQCAEGDFTVLFDGGMHTVMSGIQQITVDADGAVNIGGSVENADENGSKEPLPDSNSGTGASTKSGGKDKNAN